MSLVTVQDLAVSLYLEVSDITEQMLADAFYCEICEEFATLDEGYPTCLCN